MRPLFAKKLLPLSFLIVISSINLFAQTNQTTVLPKPSPTPITTIETPITTATPSASPSPQSAMVNTSEITSAAT